MKDLNNLIGLVTDGDSMDLLEENWFKFIGPVSDKDLVVKKEKKEIVEDDFDMFSYNPLHLIDEGDIQKPKTNSFLINSLVKNKIRDNSSRFLKALQSGRNCDLRIETKSDLEVSMRAYLSDGAKFRHDVSLFSPYNSPIFFYGKKVVEQKFIGNRSLTRHMTRYDRGLQDPYRSEMEMINEGLNQHKDQIEQDIEDEYAFWSQFEYEEHFFHHGDYLSEYDTDNPPVQDNYEEAYDFGDNYDY